MHSQETHTTLFFVCDEECLVYNRGINVLRLFNVKSGDLLSVMDIEERPCCLAVCLPHHLIAICLTGVRFRLIRVWSPQIKDRRRSKRLALRCIYLFKLGLSLSILVIDFFSSMVGFIGPHNFVLVWAQSNYSSVQN